MTAFRGSKADVPRTDVKPRYTLRGRIRHAWISQVASFQRHPVSFTLCGLIFFVLVGMFRHYFPRAYTVITLVYVSSILIWHWWSNRGAE